MSQTSRLWPAALIVLGIGLTVHAFKPAATTAQPAIAVQPAGAAGTPRYTVIDTEGTNLLVADNTSDMLYYYTVDPDKNAGDELKLRGELSLREVGKTVIKPKTHKHDK